MSPAEEAMMMAMIRAKFGPMTPASVAGYLHEPTLRNVQRPGGDTVEQRAAQGVAQGINLTGIPQAAVSIGNAVADPSAGNIGRAAFDSAISSPGMRALGHLVGPVGQAVSASMPTTTGGRVALGGGVAGTGLLADTAMGSDAPDPYEKMNSQIQAAQQRLKEIEANKSKAAEALPKQWEKLRLGPSGRKEAQALFEAEWDKKSAPYRTELDNLNKARNDLLTKIENDKAATTAAEAEKNRRANARLSELYPQETMMGQGAAAAGGLLLSGLVKGRNVARYNGEMRTAAARAEAAGAQGMAAYDRGAFPKSLAHLEEAKAAQAQLDAIKAAGPSSKGTMLPTIAGLDAAFLGPQLIDRYARSEPGSDLYNKSDPFKNPSETFMRMGGAALGGGLLSKLPTSAAGLLQAKNAPGSQGMINALDNMVSGRSLIDTDMMRKTAVNGASARGDLARANGAVALELRGAAEAARRSGGGIADQTMGGAASVPAQTQGQLLPAGSPQNLSLPAPASPAGMSTQYPPEIDRMLAGTTQGEQWARMESPAARAGLLDQLDRGKNMLPKQGRMGDPNSIVPADVSAAPAATARKQLDLLRDVLAYRGLDLSKLTRAEAERELRTIDPRIFSVPAVVGIGAHQSGLLDQ